MRDLNRLLKRLLKVATGRRGDERLREEMEQHLAMQTEENIGAGMTPEEARRQARMKLGAEGAIRGQYHAEEGLPVVENAAQDARYALRQFRRSPGYAAVAILTLALGIGANTAIFQLTYSILLKSLPVPEPGQLIRYKFDKGDSDIGLSYALYTALEKNQGVATRLFAWDNDNAVLRRNGQAEEIPIALATGTVFSVLKLEPVLGRGFSANAGEPGSAYQPEAVLGYDFWRTEFGGDPGIVGKTLNLENHSLTIVGVLPEGFEGVQAGQRVDVVVPLDFERILQPKDAMIDWPGAFWLTVMGRLRAGVTLKQAQANLGAIRNAVNDAADPKHMLLSRNGFFGTYTLGVAPGRNGRSMLRTRYSKPLVALEALCGLMMLLCGVNVTLLVLSRVSGRLHEFAMRSALGAPRARLLTQVLTETLLLGACGAALGGLAGLYLAKLLAGMLTDPGFQPLLQLHASTAIFLCTVVVGMGAALLGGLWPAWRASRTAPAADLKQIGSSRTAARLGHWIIPTQVALGMVLLYAALLLAGTLTAYLREHSGFRADRVVLAQMDVDDAGVMADHRKAKILEFLSQVEAAPGVQEAAVMSVAPLNSGFSVGDYYVRDAAGHLRVNHEIWPEQVTANYFPTMGTRIVEGRGFSASDSSGERTCILSESAAAYFFPGESAIGRYLNSGDGTEKAADRAAYRVVGVAEDARFGSLLEPAPVMAYFPMERETDSFTYVAIAVRAATPALGAGAIRGAWMRVFPNSALPKSWRFEDAVNYDLSRQRLLSVVSGGFALLALAVIATGLYGILARAVVERRREIGIRMALGSGRRQIVAELARGAALRVALGAAAGALLAGIAGRLLQRLLYGVTPESPMMAVATLGVLLIVVALAFVVPAGRAASVNPMESIRQE